MDGGYFSLTGRTDANSPSSVRSDGDISLEMTSMPSPTVAALTALQYLPVPVLVLSSEKNVMLANEAMGRLLGIEFESTATEGLTITETLMGKSMAELGIDILQNGSPILVSWEVGFHFLWTDVMGADRGVGFSWFCSEGCRRR